LEEVKPKRMRKVHWNPNTIFAKIKDIVRAKEVLGEASDVDSSDSDSSSGPKSDSGSLVRGLAYCLQVHDFRWEVY